MEREVLELAFEIGLHLEQFEPEHLRVDRDRMIASTGSLRSTSSSAFTACSVMVRTACSRISRSRSTKGRMLERCYDGPSGEVRYAPAVTGRTPLVVLFGTPVDTARFLILLWLQIVVLQDFLGFIHRQVDDVLLAHPDLSAQILKQPSGQSRLHEAIQTGLSKPTSDMPAQTKRQALMALRADRWPPS